MPAGVTEHAGHGPKHTPTLVKPGRHDGDPAVMCPPAGGHEKSPLDDVDEQAGGVHDGGCGGDEKIIIAGGCPPGNVAGRVRRGVKSEDRSCQVGGALGFDLLAPPPSCSTLYYRRLKNSPEVTS